MTLYILTDKEFEKKYKYGLNKSKEPFEFYDTDLFISLTKDTHWVREVEIPKDVEIDEVDLEDYDDVYTKYLSNEIILRSKQPLTLKTIKEICNFNVNFRVGNYNIIHWAIINNHYKIFKDFIWYVNIHEIAWKRLYVTACKYGRISIIKHLLNIDKNLIDSFNGMYYACLGNQVSTVEFLIKNGFKDNKKELIKIAKEKDYIKLINLLDGLKKPKNPNPEYICDHCHQPILKDGKHITIDDIDSSDSNDFHEGYYHRKCVVIATELKMIKDFVSR